MLTSEAPDSLGTIRRHLAFIAADLSAAREGPALPQAAARHLDSAMARIEVLQSCCPCGSFRQYLETLEKAAGPDRFSLLIE